MLPPTTHDLPNDLDPRAERMASSAAREHVGEAGFIQQDVLEHIINAGREQLVVVQALRRVVAATLEQMRATPLAEIGSVAAVHLATLEGIVTSGRTQIQTAHELRLTIQQTLIQVRETPLEHVSAHLLTRLSEAVHQQARNLEEIITAALGQANSLTQIAELERIGAEAVERLRQAEHRQGERELAHLERQAAETLEQIRALEEEGHTHAHQKQHLEHVAEQAEAHLAQLEHTEARDRAEINRLEQRQDATSVQRLTLETAAEETRETLQALQSMADPQAPDADASQSASSDALSIPKSSLH
ncbi:hypothetical protein [Deinococcus sp. QL22]|uniref:hypothetical protein n=1 Tax=Deinococcus sp. QL22 TaxID=2939437 RepID=UPI002017ED28|nr:hypothetical protein [Deinococcus sp. QL22]UQN10174.1 hypothetical protein M1R55_28765 [Deinococcus sp. QL22]